MVRSFAPEPVDAEVVRGLVEGARRAPTAGKSQGVHFLVLAGREETERYWSATLPVGTRRAGFGWPGLVAAPVLVLVLVSPETYVERYGEADKASTGLGADVDAWPVPYWFVDGGMAVMALLLGAVDAGLGVCFFGLFEHERMVLRALDVPQSWRAVGTVALGHLPSDAQHERPGRSAGRSRRPFEEVVHFGRW